MQKLVHLSAASLVFVAACAWLVQEVLSEDGSTDLKSHDIDVAARIADFGRIADLPGLLPAKADVGSEEECRCRRVFRRKNQRCMEVLAAGPLALQHFADRSGAVLRPRLEVRSTTYLVQVLAVLQAELGCQGNLLYLQRPEEALGRDGFLNNTRLLWGAVHLTRRHSERAVSRTGNRGGEAPAVAAWISQATELGTARWIFLALAPGEASLAAFAAAEASMAPGAVLAVEGLNDIYDRPEIQEAFHTLMLFINDQFPKFMYGSEILILGSVDVPSGTFQALAEMEKDEVSLALWAMALSQQHSAPPASPPDEARS